MVKFVLAATLAATVISAPLYAQDAAFTLPEQCIVSVAMDGMDHSAIGHGAQSDDMTTELMRSENARLDTMPEHVQENMRKMAITMRAMEEGMMNEDANVAFACAMIAHHQGAIDMARVLLEHGDDPEMIELAEEIIAAQVGEIEQMTTWLIQNAD